MIPHRITKQENLQEISEFGLEPAKLIPLFEKELNDLYWEEKALMNALPELIKKTTSTELVTVLKKHLTVTESHVKKVEQVFESMHKKPQASKCKTMQEPDERVTGIISATQKVPREEIAFYTRTFAQTLGLKTVITLLNGILEEEKAADQNLTATSTSTINMRTSEETA